MLTIFKILSLWESARNLQQKCGSSSHHTLNVFLHYLAKFKFSYIIIFNYNSHKNLALKSELFCTLTNKYSVGYHGYLFRSFMWQMIVLAKTILSEEDKALTYNVSLSWRWWISMSHDPNSPDLNPEDYNIWLEMWQQVYQTKFHNAKEVNQWFLDMWHVWSKASSMTFLVHQLRHAHNWWVV